MGALIDGKEVPRRVSGKRRVAPDDTAYLVNHAGRWRRVRYVPGDYDAAKYIVVKGTRKAVIFE